MLSSFLLSMGSKRGNATLLALILLSILLILTAALGANVTRAYSISMKDYLKAKAFHIAESGLHKALWELSCSPASYSGEEETHLGEGVFTVEVSSLDGEPDKRIITSTGFTFDATGLKVRLRALVHLRASTSGESSVVLEHWELLN